MNCDRYALVILGIILNIPITANTTYSQEPPATVQKNKENIKISRELNLNRQVETFNLLTVDQFEQNAIAKPNNPNYKQPQKIVKGDTQISTSAADIQHKSHLSNQSDLFYTPKLDPSQFKFKLATKPVIGKSYQNLFSDSATFPPINDFIIADKNHSNQPGKWSSARPDGHAPIGVMADHTHGKGEFMFSYRYMFMNMNGNRKFKLRLEKCKE